MNTTSQLTKGIHPPTYLRKLLGCSEIATKHFISTHEECSPQNSPFWLNLASFIYSSMSVCTCEHTLHISIISFTFNLYTYLDLHSSHHTLYMLQKIICCLGIILRILFITRFIKHINMSILISNFLHIICLHGHSTLYTIG